MMEKRNLQKIGIKSILGFNGDIQDGLCLHPNLDFIIYSCISLIIIQNLNTKEQKFLENDTSNEITTLSISKTGNLLAAGYSTYPGFKAVIVIWQFHSHQKLLQYESHKDKIYSIRFTFCENYVLSLGGYDESNNLICFDIRNKEICCGSNASKSTSGDARILYIFDIVDYVFATAGENTVRMWKLNIEKKYLEYEDVSFFKYKRNIQCIEADDSFLYCGTNSGDVLKFKFSRNVETILIRTVTLFGCYGKVFQSNKKRTQCFSDADSYKQGINALLTLAADRLIIGCGDGTVELVEQSGCTSIHSNIDTTDKLQSPTMPLFVKIKSINVNSAVITLRKKNELIFIGTADRKIYIVGLLRFHLQTFLASHTDTITDIRFLHDFSQVFATASGHHIRLWNADTYDQLLCITEAHLLCTGVAFTNDGKLIISIWQDGSLRTYTPRTGRNECTIEKAHYNEPTIITTSSGRRIITGDMNGEIRFWSCHQHTVHLVGNVAAAHKGPVRAAHIKGNMAITCGTEGLCRMWDIETQRSKLSICCYTICNSVKFHPTKEQIFTCGIDKRIRVWSSETGKLLKVIEVSRNATYSSDLSTNGELFVTGGYDLKLWHCASNITLIGVGSCPINIRRLCFSPDNKRIITVFEDNTVAMWNAQLIVPTKTEHISQ